MRTTSLHRQTRHRLLVDVRQRGLHALVWYALVLFVLFQDVRADTRTCATVEVTRQFTFIYGNIVVDGLPASMGSIVEAHNTSGDIVGCQTVVDGGTYPLMYVYGEETVGERIIPGMRDGETITFVVNGQTAVPAQVTTWHNDWTSHRVDLAVTGVSPTSNVVYLPAISR